MNVDERLLKWVVLRLTKAHREPPTVLALLFTWPGLPLLALVGGVGVGILSALDLPSAVPLVMAGVVLGAALRDFGTARKTVRLWPIHCELYDWQKIAALAEQFGE